MSNELKPEFTPKGATHWQPKAEWIREAFYKKTSHGVSFYIPSDCDGIAYNRWEGSGEIDIATVIPLNLINRHDALTAEVAQLKQENERLTKIIEKDIQLYPVLKSLVNDEEANNDHSK